MIENDGNGLYFDCGGGNRTDSLSKSHQISAYYFIYMLQQVDFNYRHSRAMLS
jgi:hypothetical protein